MESIDTVYLLKECDAGTKMAVSSIDEVLDNVRDSGKTRERDSHTFKRASQRGKRSESHRQRNVLDENKYENDNGQKRLRHREPADGRLQYGSEIPA